MQRRAHRVADAVRTRRSIWLDTEKMDTAAQGEGGTHDAMVSGIDGCDVFVCCMSEIYMARKNCMRELKYADEKNKTVLFVNIGEAGWTPSGALLFILAGRLWSDCRTPDTFDEGIKRLLKKLS